MKNKVEKPSKLLLEALKEAREDRKTGRCYSFENPQDAIKFIDKIIGKKK